jgi:predicted Zn-dependent protease with MMP-like domain
VSIEVSRRRFEQLVADALDSIPEDLAEQISNVAVMVEDWPGPEHGDAHGDARGLLLGLYQGVDLTHRTPLNYSGVLPDRITIFRGPICAIVDSEEELVAQVRTTVLHEVGHHFGIGDARLRELGWG